MKYWKEIKQSEVVEENNGAFYAVRFTMQGGKVSDLIYWHGHEQPEAQRELTRRSKAYADLQYLTHLPY
jgi:hypothetical protein